MTEPGKHLMQYMEFTARALSLLRVAAIAVEDQPHVMPAQWEVEVKKLVALINDYQEEVLAPSLEQEWN